MNSVAGIPVKTTFLIILLAFVVVLLIIAAYKINPQKPKQQEAGNISPQTILTISQNPILSSTPSGSFYTENIFIDTGNNKINSVQLELYYNPKLLTVYDIVPGSFFENPNVLLKTIDAANGRISLAFSTPNNSVVSGTGISSVITLSLSKDQKTATEAAFAFLPKTQVSAPNFSGSLLKTARSASFIVYPFVSPTPTPRIKIASGSALLGSPSAR